MLTNQVLKKTLSLCISLALIMPVCVTADLRYEETTEIKGGIMESLGKVAGMFGAKGLDKSTTSTCIKGDRLRRDQLNGVELVSSQIIQLDREQISVAGPQEENVHRDDLCRDEGADGKGHSFGQIRPAEPAESDA